MPRLFHHVHTLVYMQTYMYVCLFMRNLHGGICRELSVSKLTWSSNHAMHFLG